MSEVCTHLLPLLHLVPRSSGWRTSVTCWGPLPQQSWEGCELGSFLPEGCSCGLSHPWRLPPWTAPRFCLRARASRVTQPSLEALTLQPELPGDQRKQTRCQINMLPPQPLTPIKTATSLSKDREAVWAPHCLLPDDVCIAETPGLGGQVQALGNSGCGLRMYMVSAAQTPLSVSRPGGQWWWITPFKLVFL